MPTRQTNSPIFIPGKASVFKAEPPPPFYYILTPNLAKVKTAAVRVNPLSIPMERGQGVRNSNTRNLHENYETVQFDPNPLRFFRLANPNAILGVI